MIDAIVFKYRTVTPWMDLPERFGPWKGVHNRLRKWAADGTWEKVFTALLGQADTEGGLDRVVVADPTIVRAHQHAAEARQKGPPTRPPTARASAAKAAARRLSTVTPTSSATPSNDASTSSSNGAARPPATIYLAGLHLAAIFIWSAR